MWHGVLSRHIVNNTFYNTAGGVNSIFDGPVHLNNNIFNSIRLTNANTSHISITHAGRTGLSSQDGNLFGIAASFRWWNSERPADNLPRGESFTLSDYTTNYPTQCTTCAENIDPLFVDPLNANFRLQSTSPIIDNSSESYVYQRFFDLYGIDIRVDYDGNTRPNGSGWEAGAFEYYDTSATAPAITTSSFYDAQQGVEYTATLIGYGGRTPYTWSIQNGALPTGLTLAVDGTITGTPTEAGNFTIDTQITDLNSVSNTKMLSITVVGAAATPTAPEINTTNNDSSSDASTTDSDGGGALWGLNIFALLLILSTRKVLRSRQQQV